MPWRDPRPEDLPRDSVVKEPRELWQGEATLEISRGVGNGGNGVYGSEK